VHVVGSNHTKDEASEVTGEITVTAVESAGADITAFLAPKNPAFLVLLPLLTHEQDGDE
jgi:hypothetical protein